MKQFKPLGDRVLVKPNEVKEEKSGGGIIISESMTHGKKVQGEVIEVGSRYIFTEWRKNTNDCTSR